MNSVEIRNDSTTQINKVEIENKVKSFLSRLNLDNYQLGIYFIPADQMKRLNRDYRGKDRLTDVLSFPIDQPLKNKLDSTEEIILGDIFVSPSQAKDSNDLYKIVKHGLVHLLGLDHEKDEEEFEKYLEK